MSCGREGWLEGSSASGSLQWFLSLSYWPVWSIHLRKCWCVRVTSSSPLLYDLVTNFSACQRWTLGLGLGSSLIYHSSPMAWLYRGLGLHEASRQLFSSHLYDLPQTYQLRIFSTWACLDRSWILHQLTRSWGCSTSDARCQVSQSPLSWLIAIASMLASLASQSCSLVISRKSAD